MIFPIMRLIGLILMMIGTYWFISSFLAACENITEIRRAIEEIRDELKRLK